MIVLFNSEYRNKIQQLDDNLTAASDEIAQLRYRIRDKDIAILDLTEERDRFRDAFARRYRIKIIPEPDLSQAPHPGRQKTKKLLRSRYYWPTWNYDVDRYLDNCLTCKRMKTTRDRTPGLLQPLPVPARPCSILVWTSVHSRGTVMDMMPYSR